MKNTQKGFIIPLLSVIIALLIIGGGGYFYLQNKNFQNQRDENNISNIITSTSSQDSSVINKKLSSINIEHYTNQELLISTTSDFNISGVAKIATSSTLTVVINNLDDHIVFVQNGIVPDKSTYWSVLAHNIPDGVYSIDVYEDDHLPCSESACNLLQYSNNLLNVESSSSKQEQQAVVVLVQILNGSFGTGNVWFTTDSNDKKWKIDYSIAKFFEKNITFQTPIQRGDFYRWVRTSKEILNPVYSGPGAEGAIKIIGVIKDDILYAYQIIHYLQ